ncbi:hypothetical protein GCM10023189_39440 [Nibrella saemangeumensis]|uniref:AB hydrolase-1 domain-containing protein n=1 Tax=Nibrella saemangeumensis TaxID=1084526 RepID=A0ABP8NAB3_9BACT
MKAKQTLFTLALSALLFVSCKEERFIDQPGNLVPKTVDQDAGLPAITVNGARLHSEAFGHPDSPMIVAIHGGPGGDYRYLLNLKQLAEHGYRVVFYDQRGSGLSQRFPEKSYTALGAKAVDLMYDDLRGVIAHYRTSSSQKVFLLGYSWGGILAAGYAGKHPEAIQGLVVCEPGGLRWDDIMTFVSKSRSFNPWSESLNNASYLDQFTAGKEDQHDILDHKLALQSAKDEVTGEDNTTPGSFWRSGAVINTALFKVGRTYKPDFTKGLSRFSTPVLFLYSDQNKAYPPAWAQRISGAFPSADLFQVSGVGHTGIVKDKTTWQQVTLPKMLNYFKTR